MFLCLSVLIAVIVALFRGGKWSNLSTFKFKMQWLVFVAIILQVMIFNPIWGKYQVLNLYTNYIYIVSMVLLIAFALANIRVAGIKAIFAGMLSNAIAIIANGGYMPSDPAALKNLLSVEAMNQLQSGSASYNSVVINEQTNLKYLSDIIYIPNINVYSIGDVLIAVGAFIIIQRIMMNRSYAYKKL